MTVAMMIFAVILAASQLHAPVVLWTGDVPPPQVKDIKVIRGSVVEAVDCNVRKAEEAFDKGRSHYEFLEVDRAEKYFRRVVRITSRMPLCSRARRWLALSHLYLSVCRLVVGKDKSAANYMKKAVKEGLWQDLSEVEFPPPVTRLHRRVLSKVPMCPWEFEHPFGKEIETHIDAVRVKVGHRIPCGKHLAEAFVDGLAVTRGDITVEEKGSVSLPLVLTEGVAKKLLEQDRIQAWFHTQQRVNNTVLVRITTSDREYERLGSFEDLKGEFVRVLKGSSDGRSSTEKKIQLLPPAVSEGVHERRVPLVPVPLIAEKKQWYRNPYIWGGDAGIVAVAAGVFLGVKVFSDEGKRGVFIVTW